MLQLTAIVTWQLDCNSLQHQEWQADFQAQCLKSHMMCLQIVNLVSNDVRRFDDAMPFWVFLWGGPLELICVLILLSIELGPPAAFAGVATMLLVIPTQVQIHASRSTHSPHDCFLQSAA